MAFRLILKELREELKHKQAAAAVDSAVPGCLELQFSACTKFDFH